MPISIHAPHTGRDFPLAVLADVVRISIHAPHTGRDLFSVVGTGGWSHFNPRAPYGARPAVDGPVRDVVGISIHAPHTGRDLPILSPLWYSMDISIHAPHTGRDLIAYKIIKHHVISIHAPHTGRDQLPHLGHMLAPGFQSTRPIRGATVTRATAAKP